MQRIVIIDDEEHILDSLNKLLNKYCPQAVVAGTATGVADGIRAIRELSPDLVLLDIQMNDGTGFDLLQSFPSPGFNVIFITAFDQYALQAFRFSAVDYLLKPVNPEHLVASVNRAALLSRDHIRVKVETLQANLKADAIQDKKIVLKTTDQIYLFNLKDIVSCESDSCYTTFVLADGQRVMVARTLKEYEEMLSGCGFYRVHRSYLINLSHIRRFERQDGGYIVLTNEVKVPVASRKRDEVLALLEEMAK